MSGRIISPQFSLIFYRWLYINFLGHNYILFICVLKFLLAVLWNYKLVLSPCNISSLLTHTIFSIVLSLSKEKLLSVIRFYPWNGPVMVSFWFSHLGCRTEDCVKLMHSFFHCSFSSNKINGTNMIHNQMFLHFNKICDCMHSHDNLMINARTV